MYTPDKTHLIGTVDQLAGDLHGRIRAAVLPITDEGTNMAAFMDHAIGRFDEELSAALAPQGITYRALDGFYMKIPETFSPAAVESGLDVAEDLVRIELSDLLDDGGLADSLSPRRR